MALVGEKMTGSQLILQALVDQGVEVIFGYPGGAVLPIYDALFDDKRIRHILVRHEQGAIHAAEGYARSTGKVGVVLVTSGPGATNIVTGLADALLDSIPVVCLTGQVATHLIGNDAFQEADTVGITRPCTKHNWLVRSTDNLARRVHEAFYVARTGRPGPVLLDIPKDVQINEGAYYPPEQRGHKTYRPQLKGDIPEIRKAVQIMMSAKRPIIYSGGGVINSGKQASKLLRELVECTDFPITSTLMGLGAYPASGKNWLGMLGMHGSKQANLAMHECDVMLCVGARFDDRITGRIDAFSPSSRKIHIDIDASSINKNVMVEVGIVGDCAHVLEDLIRIWRSEAHRIKADRYSDWNEKIKGWSNPTSFTYRQGDKMIKPQYAIERLYQHTQEKKQKTFITTEVGQHQMWAAQFFHFDKPNHWITSGGLGTMGFGLPAAIGVQAAYPDALVVDIAGEASVLMTMQEMSTALQHDLPIKVFILNNKYMGMVRQWQELIHGGRYSHSYSSALPDFVKLAEAYGALGLRAESKDELDDKIKEMLESDRPVLFDCVVDPDENCYPMIPSGAAHNEMLMSEEDEENLSVSDEGKVMV